MKYYFLTIFLVGWISLANAQDRCSNVFDATQLKPELNQRIEEYYNRVEDLIQNRETRSLTVYNFNPSNGAILIPVVVHIVHRTTAQNISDAQICSQIDILNEDFGRYPTLSPNSKYIIFCHVNDSYSREVIWRVNIDGQNRTQLTF